MNAAFRSGKENHPLRLMILVPSLACGGLERNVAHICNHIDTCRFQVILVVLDNSNPFYSINNPEVSIIDLGCQKVSRSVFTLTSFIRKNKPDILLSAANHLNLLVAMLKPFLPATTKYIARESSIVSINTNRNRFPFLFHRLLKLFYRRFDMIVCQSAYMQKDLLDHYNVKETKTTIINNFISTPNKVITRDTKTTDSLQLISIGRLSEEKGFERVISSLRQLKSNFHYNIIGEGPQRKNLEDFISRHHMTGKIILAGISTHPFDVVASPQFLLLGSYYEGFPNVALEALSLGIPVISFDAPGGISEIIEQKINGILVKDGDESAYADAIEKAITFPFDREAIRNKTLKRYSPEAIMQQWQELIQSVFSSTDM